MIRLEEQIEGKMIIASKQVKFRVFKEDFS
jgi:hypothetical protein